MVARVGPTVFTIKNEQDDTFRVTLGNPHLCSCGIQDETCIHKLFCLIKVLKVPVEHSLCFQSSLTDSEMDQVLDGIQTGSTRRPIRARAIRAVAVVSEDLAKDTCVARQPIVDGEENTCTICMDDMTHDQALTWCRVGCGQNIHAKCMMKCAQHNITNKLSITCPLCRNLMDLPTLKLDLKGKSSLKHSYAPVQCVSCKCNQRGDFFRCVECSQIAVQGSEKPLDYCPECFERQSDPVHYKHHFVQSNIATEAAHGVDWIPSKNPATRGMLMNTELVRELQNRELGVNDYEMLLQLSNGGPVSDFPILCVESLPVYNKGKAGKRGAGPYSLCWCAASLSPSRSQSHIIVHSPITGAAELSTVEQPAGGGGTSGVGSGENSSHRESKRLMRVLPCKHVAHDRCLQEEVGALVTDDTARITEYRCSHVECSQKVFVGLSRRRKSNKKPVAAAGEKMESGKREIIKQSHDITSGIVGASCFGSTVSGGGGLGSSGSLQVNRTMHRRGRNFCTTDESGSSSAATSMDLSVHVASLQSSGGISGMAIGGGNHAGGTYSGGQENVWGTTERADSFNMQQRLQQHPPAHAPLTETLSFEVNASGFSGSLPWQRTREGLVGGYGVAVGGGGGRGGGGRGIGSKPPAGRRVRLRALSEAAATAHSSSNSNGLHGAIGGMGLDGHRNVASTMESMPLQLGRSARRDLGFEFGGVDVSSLSDRAPSPAPLPSLRHVQRSASLGSSSQFPGITASATRSAEVRASVSNVLVFSRQKNRPREAAHTADPTQLVMEVMSLSNPGMVVLPNQQPTSAFNVPTAVSSSSSSSSRPSGGGRIIRGGLRNNARTGAPVADVPQQLTQQHSMLQSGLSNSRNGSNGNLAPPALEP